MLRLTAEKVKRVFKIGIFEVLINIKPCKKKKFYLLFKKNSLSIKFFFCIIYLFPKLNIRDFSSKQNSTKGGCHTK